jgi:hypothetical protein
MKKVLVACLLMMMVLIPTLVLAQGRDLVLPTNPGGLPGNGGEDSEDFIAGFILMILYFAGSIAVLFIIIGGMQYILSGANEDLAKRGKTTLQNAVIGLIIVILSYLIVTVVVNTLFNNAP